MHIVSKETKHQILFKKKKREIQRERIFFPQENKGIEVSEEAMNKLLRQIISQLKNYPNSNNSVKQIILPSLQQLPYIYFLFFHSTLYCERINALHKPCL